MKINDNGPLVTPARIQKAKPENVRRLAKFVNAPDYSPQAVFLQARLAVLEARQPV